MIMNNKMNKNNHSIGKAENKSKSPRTTKSAEPIVTAQKVSQEMRRLIPQMNQKETIRLITRLTSGLEDSDYGKEIDKKISELK